MELAHSVRVFDLLSSHPPNMDILYIKLKLIITAIGCCHLYYDVINNDKGIT